MKKVKMVGLSHRKGQKFTTTRHNARILERIGAAARVVRKAPVEKGEAAADPSAQDAEYRALIALRDEFRALVGRSPLQRWGADELRAKIAERKAAQVKAAD